MKLIIPVMLVLFIILGCSKENDTSLKDNVNFTPLKAGSPATDFLYKDMEGRQFRLSEKKGSVVVVLFWRMKCGECRGVMRSLEALHRKYRDKGLVVVAVDADSMHSAPVSTVAQFIKEEGFTFIVMRDDDGFVAEAFNAMKAPEAYVIDKDGTIASIVRGDSDWMSGQASALVESLLERH